MRTLPAFVAFAALIGTGLLSGGCIAREEYDRVEFARRTAAQRATELERELADERTQRKAIESERNSLRRELDNTTALYENCNAEKARLVDQLKREQGLTDEAIRRGLSAPAVIEVAKLPPELDKALKEFAARHPGVVEYLPDRGAVRWKSDLTFALGSDVVREGALSPLREFAEIVNSSAAAGFEVVIVGHTDNVPIRASAREHKTNWHLSTHRSIAVMFALNRAGVGFTRMGCMGYGEYQPREPNPATGGNERNRRVEIYLVDKSSSFAGTASAEPMPPRGQPFIGNTEKAAAPEKAAMPGDNTSGANEKAATPNP